AVIFPAGAFAVTGVAAMTFAGETAPLAFLIGGITLFFAIIAVYIFSQKISNAGGYYKYVEGATQNKYISKSVGLWHLFWVIGDMIAASIIVGWFIWVGLSSLLNYTIPFYDIILLSLIVPILYLIVGYFGIKTTARTAITIGLLQIILFLIFAVALIIKTPYNSLSYFDIRNSTNGLYGFFLAMVVGAFLAYGGYGSIVSLGEEAKFSKVTLKKAIVTALLIMVAFDTFVVYSIVAAAGPNLSLADSSFAPGLYMSDKFFGVGVALVAFVFVVFAQIFSPVIFGNSGARTAFALARDGLLPRNLAKVHERYKSPHIATLWVFIILVIGIFATIIPMVSLLGESNGLFYSWAVWGTAITIFTLFYHIVTNNTLVFLIRRMKTKINILSHIIGPSIASIIMIIAIYYSLAGLTGPMMAVYVLVPAWLIISLALIYIRRNRTKVETVEELTAG
ncbi:MAG: APC family permease, partial [Candidatus Micrarchaeaceae archaeon]